MRNPFRYFNGVVTLTKNGPNLLVNHEAKPLKLSISTIGESPRFRCKENARAGDAGARVGSTGRLSTCCIPSSPGTQHLPGSDIQWATNAIGAGLPNLPAATGTARILRRLAATTFAACEGLPMIGKLLGHTQVDPHRSLQAFCGRRGFQKAPGRGRPRGTTLLLMSWPMSARPR